VLNIILLFASFSRLRFSEPELARPYRVPFISRHTSVRLPPPCRVFPFELPRCQQKNIVFDFAMQVLVVAIPLAFGAFLFGMKSLQIPIDPTTACKRFDAFCSEALFLR
jgi:hypothetical protein